MNAVRMVELEDFCHRRPAELSGGQKKGCFGKSNSKKPNVF